MLKSRASGVVFAFLICLSTVSMFILAGEAKDYENLFFACPQIDAAVPVEKASELNLTYETPAMGADITIFSVNHAYSRIMSYNMLRGSFFTQTAQEEKRKNVVLNEKAAFEAFGNFDVAGNIYMINGEPYVVVGVMDDKQEEKHAYIPADSTAANFLAVIDTGEKTIADLKNLGINENRFYLVNLDEISSAIQGKPGLAIMIAVGLTLILLLRITILQIINCTKGITNTLHKKYWSELIKTKEIRSLIIFAIVAVIEMAVILWMFLKSVETALQWANCAGELKEITSLAFGGKVQRLKSLCLYSNLAFCVCIGGILIGGIKFRRKAGSFINMGNR